MELDLAERNALVMQYSRLAHKEALYAYEHYPLVRKIGELEDVTQVAFLGLLNAIRCYDPDRPARSTGKPVKPITYFTAAIRNYLRSKANDYHMLPVPEFIRTNQMDRIRPERRETYLRHAERAWHVQSLAENFDVPEPEASRRHDKDRWDPELLRSCLRRLSKRDQFILERRYGLDGLPEHTLEEVGDLLGVHKERVRQLEDRALGRLYLQMSYARRKRKDPGTPSPRAASK